MTEHDNNRLRAALAIGCGIGAIAASAAAVYGFALAAVIAGGLLIAAGILQATSA